MFISEEEMQVSQKSKKHSGSEDGISKNFLQIHESCLNRGATPRKFMTYLKTYKFIFSGKKQGIVTKQQHLQVRRLQGTPVANFTITIECIVF